LAQTVDMNSKPERYKLIPKLIILINAMFIIAMIFFNKGIHHSTNKEEPCANTKKISVDALNSISIKLM
jgi:hypothetical protein